MLKRSMMYLKHFLQTNQMTEIKVLQNEKSAFDGSTAQTMKKEDLSTGKPRFYLTKNFNSSLEIDPQLKKIINTDRKNIQKNRKQRKYETNDTKKNRTNCNNNHMGQVGSKTQKLGW